MKYPLMASLGLLGLAACGGKPAGRAVADNQVEISNIQADDLTLPADNALAPAVDTEGANSAADQGGDSQ